MKRLLLVGVKWLLLGRTLGMAQTVRRGTRGKESRYSERARVGMSDGRWSQAWQHLLLQHGPFTYRWADRP
jgi:hypothetical protein